MINACLINRKLKYNICIHSNGGLNNNWYYQKTILCCFRQLCTIRNEIRFLCCYERFHSPYGCRKINVNVSVTTTSNCLSYSRKKTSKYNYNMIVYHISDTKLFYKYCATNKISFELRNTPYSFTCFVWIFYIN